MTSPGGARTGDKSHLGDRGGISGGPGAAQLRCWADVLPQQGSSKLLGLRAAMALQGQCGHAAISLPLSLQRSRKEGRKNVPKPMQFAEGTQV